MEGVSGRRCQSQSAFILSHLESTFQPPLKLLSGKNVKVLVRSLISWVLWDPRKVQIVSTLYFPLPRHGLLVNSKGKAHNANMW